MSNNPVQFRRLRPLLEDPATSVRRSASATPVPASIMYGGDPNTAKFRKGSFQVPSLHPGRARDPFTPSRTIGTPSTISGTTNALPKESFYMSPAEKERVLRQYKMNQVIDKGLSKLDGVAPYLSNVMNSFRRPPSPAAPTLLKPVTFGRVNYGASRAEAEQQVYGANANLNMLGENQAVAVRSANLAKGLKEINRINETEANQNTQIGIQQAQANAQIDAQNTGMLNAYEDSKVNQRLAEIQQRSANLANAADKFIGIGNQKSLMELEKDKYAILQQLYKPSGVLERFTKPMEINPETGMPTYTKQKFGGKLKYMAGGILRRVYGPKTN